DDEKLWLYSPDETELSPVDVISTDREYDDGVLFDLDTILENMDSSSPLTLTSCDVNSDKKIDTSSIEENDKSRNYGTRITRHRTGTKNKCTRAKRHRTGTKTKRHRTGTKTKRTWTRTKSNYGEYFYETKIGNNDVIKCTHCEATKTPQWREGPLGPKTLCNACGVRFKAGRLFPEYRPVASPTFNKGKHSNWHKQVLKIRDMHII
ncbi:hypothetical protein RND81_04G210200, partial [Saponaria officinalis]